MHHLFCVLAVLAFLAISGNVAAQSNDNCSGAIVVPLSGIGNCIATLGNNSTGTISTVDPSCDDTNVGFQDVWYAFNSGNNTQLTITLDPGVGMTDHAFAIFTGCGGAEVLCTVLPTGGFAWNFTPNTNYVMMVYSNLQFGAGGPFTLCIEAPDPGSGTGVADECIAALPVQVMVPGECANGIVLGNNATATDSGEDPSCDATNVGHADVWYTFNSGPYTLVNVSLTPGAGMTDHALIVKTACGGSQIACAVEPTAPVGVPVTPNTSYVIMVYSNLQFGVGGDFTLCVEGASGGGGGPLNDICAGAFTLPVNGNCVPTAGSVQGATDQGLPGACGGNANDDVWYKFVATNVAAFPAALATGFDLVLEVWSGACGAQTLLACYNSQGAGGQEGGQLNSYVVGNTYYLRVYSFGATAPSTANFNICVVSPDPPPVNNSCSSAITIPVNTSCANTSGTVAWATGGGPLSCFSEADDDVWYSFVANAGVATVTADGASGFDMALEVFQGTCAGLDYLDCQDNTGPGQPEQITLTDLTIGDIYFVRIYSLGIGYPSTPTFTICVTSPGPPPVNDECTGAIELPMNVSCQYVSGSVAGATPNVSGYSGCSGEGENDEDVWYRFTATSTFVGITVDGDGSFDPVVEFIFSDVPCGPFNTLVCADNTGTGGIETIEFDGISQGNTYYVLVYDAGTGMPGTTTFNICVEDAGTSVGVNEQGAVTSSSLLMDADGRRVALLSMESGPFEWSVISAAGQLVRSGSAHVSSDVPHWLDLQALPSGVYVLYGTLAGQRRTHGFNLP